MYFILGSMVDIGLYVPPYPPPVIDLLGLNLE